LLKNAGLGLYDQEIKLQESLENWQGNHEQVDDILVLAIKFW
jgi:hypothetical protein